MIAVSPLIVGQPGVGPGPLDFQSSASTELASAPCGSPVCKHELVATSSFYLKSRVSTKTKHTLEVHVLQGPLKTSLPK